MNTQNKNNSSVVTTSLDSLKITDLVIRKHKTSHCFSHCLPFYKIKLLQRINYNESLDQLPEYSQKLWRALEVALKVKSPVCQIQNMPDMEYNIKYISACFH